jgi:hypothetical protein
MTLFSLAADDPENPFRQALDRWCGGQPDRQTLALNRLNWFANSTDQRPALTMAGGGVD